MFCLDPWPVPSDSRDTINYANWRHCACSRFRTLIMSRRIFYLSGIVFSLLAQELAALEVQLCEAPAGQTEVLSQQEYFGIDGEPVWLILSVEPLLATSCQRVSLATENSELRWSGLLPAAVAESSDNGLLLQGLFPDSAPIAISEISPIGQTATISPGRLRFGDNLLRSSEARVFGREERAQWLDNTLACRAGSQPAGVQFVSDRHWPQGADAHLAIQASGSGEFELALADQARIRSQQPLPLANLPSGAATFSQNALPPGQWQALTILCPNTTSRLAIESASILPSAPGQSNTETKVRGAWLWQPALWQQDPQQIWQIARDQSLDEIYITVPVSADGNVPVENLRLFLNEADARQIKVWPVIGDRRDVLEQSWPDLRRRIRAYAAFNASQSGQPLLAGVQLDIEPYLLPGFSLDPAHWRERYLETVAFARAVVGPFLNIDLVVPVWWGSHPQFGEAFLDRLADYHVSLTVMNYRTSVPQLIAGAQPFLAWAETYQRPLRIALEAGGLQDEIQKVFLPSSTGGELWRIDFDVLSALLLFEQQLNGLPGTAYGLTETRDFAAANLSFEGDLERLRTVASYLLDQYSHWPAFQGISLHGLDEVYRNQLAK